MFLNLTTLRTELGNRIKRPSLANDRKDQWLNLAQDDIAMMFDLKHLEEKSDFTVNNTRVGFLKANYLDILQVMDLTNDREVTEKSEQYLLSLDPDSDETGSPYYYALLQRSEAKSASAASTIQIVSSNAGDTSQKVRIVGYVNGVRRTELVTLTGLAIATSTLSFSFPLLGCKKDSATLGVVTVTDTTSSFTLAEISPEDFATEYQALSFYPYPSTSNSFRAFILRQPVRMINVEDSPDMPHIFHEGVLIRASIRGMRDMWGFKEANQMMKEEWIPYLENIRRYQRPRGTRAPVLGHGSRLTPVTNLPSEYPA